MFPWIVLPLGPLRLAGRSPWKTIVTPQQRHEKICLRECRGRKAPGNWDDYQVSTKAFPVEDMGFTGLRLLGVGGCSCIGKGSSWRDILSIEPCLLDKTFEEPLYRDNHHLNSRILSQWRLMIQCTCTGYTKFTFSLSLSIDIYIYVQRYIENRIESYWPPVYSIISSLSLWLVWEPHIFCTTLPPSSWFRATWIPRRGSYPLPANVTPLSP